jgi:preprotein translocase subunit SecG
VIYLKSALLGIVRAFVAIVIVMVVLLQLSFGEGSGAAFLLISEWQILVAGVTGFCLGFWGTLRRGRTLRRT